MAAYSRSLECTNIVIQSIGVHIHMVFSASLPPAEETVLAAAVGLLHLPQHGDGLCWWHPGPHQLSRLYPSHHRWYHCPHHQYRLDLLHLCGLQLLPGSAGRRLLVMLLCFLRHSTNVIFRATTTSWLWCLQFFFLNAAASFLSEVRKTTPHDVLIIH